MRSPEGAFPRKLRTPSTAVALDRSTQTGSFSKAELRTEGKRALFDKPPDFVVGPFEQNDGLPVGRAAIRMSVTAHGVAYWGCRGNEVG
jgi:hypothetical protein